MHLSSILLAAAAALLANCDAASTASLTKLSAINVPDAVQQADVAPAKNARFLRSKHHEQDNVKDAEGEERGAAQVNLLDDAAKTLGISDDAFMKWIRSSPALKKAAEVAPVISKSSQKEKEMSLFATQIQRGLDESSDVNFIIGWWKKQNLQPKEALLTVKTKAQESAYDKFLVQFLNGNNAAKPAPQKLSKQAAEVEQKINANKDIKRMVDWWMYSDTGIAAAKASIKGDTGKDAYKLYLAKYMNKKHGLNPGAWGNRR
ncbi:hypothetical protein PC129_g6714 [Phytophthora cactorum]|uniref:RxLR effector protein n=2 Tax=Phytophthora cactorum TaxID=29920 RepID=A0A329RUA8_9STRA|nr:hypothetical protein Pcac1_g15770 [Phytophthora cactorum]KAG2810722.1 hypothetical protein PC112_g15932 [Phytophthora cactorum]KAG2834685.1 hypothetical protein PC111_g5722 [Phytophthora cactorum]KAG2861575.1 hypothetical protein PC113_g7044 [Phytophthora cactorum]KAG2902563.1 hypothetical protein PC115_g15544 [Phytophthora cactorum]